MLYSIWFWLIVWYLFGLISIIIGIAIIEGKLIGGNIIFSLKFGGLGPFVIIIIALAWVSSLKVTEKFSKKIFWESKKYNERK